jgi:tetratricopeptide (TPR) repeat protein
MVPCLALNEGVDNNMSDLNVSKYQIKEELRKQWAAKAVEMALMSRWDDAVQANLQILEVFPEDTPARNRLGKAYYELGRPEDALAAYEQSLQKQPSNNIARKKLAELYAHLNRQPAMKLGEGMPAIEIAEEEAEEAEFEDYLEEESAESSAEEDTAD